MIHGQPQTFSATGAIKTTGLKSNAIVHLTALSGDASVVIYNGTASNPAAECIRLAAIRGTSASIQVPVEIKDGGYLVLSGTGIVQLIHV